MGLRCTIAEMLTYSAAEASQVDEFLALMRSETEDYLQATMQIMGMTWERFAELFRTVGTVYGIYSDGILAGFYWIELRGSVLHLHGLVFRPEFQGQGLGKQVLLHLEENCPPATRLIELGVHRSNPRAIALYEKMGFEKVRSLEEVGFYVMQKQLNKGGG